MMIKKIKQRLGLYRPGKEYWVYLQDIKVPEKFRKTKIGRAKYLHKWDYYKKTGEFESLIKLDKYFNLIDGYSTYVIANIAGLGKVSVVFEI